MHDFHLADEIVRLAREQARSHGLVKVFQVVIELGDLIEHGESISAENLGYNINLLMPCRVKVKKIKGDRWRLVSIEGE
jgi:hypothetical protein